MNQVIPAKMLRRCFAVVYSNYEPLEVDSLWDTEEKAESQVKYLNRDPLGSAWRVQEMEIQ
jgi:hypothetical protein